MLCIGLYLIHIIFCFILILLDYLLSALLFTYSNQQNVTQVLLKKKISNVLIQSIKGQLKIDPDRRYEIHM